MSREVKIGIFIGAALLILAAFIFIVGDMMVLFRKSGYPLYVSFDSTAGLDKRALVRMSGVKVGIVKDIRLKGRKAEVLLDIDSGVEIPQGSTATLASLGLLGEKYVEILPGEKPTFCQPGDAIEGSPSVSFDQLGTLLFSVGSEVKQLGATLREMVGEEARSNFQETLENLSSVTRSLEEFFGENQQEVNNSIRQASQAVQNFDQRVKEISENLSETVSLLKDIASENRDDVKANLEKMKALIDKIEEAVELLNSALEKISKGEGTLGKLVNEPELYTKAEETVENVKKTISPFSSLKADVDFRLDYYGKSDLLKNFFSFDLWTSPRVYYRAQVVDDPFRDRLTYSIQWSRRWGSIAPRVGIIESEFGVGLDFSLTEHRVKFSLDAYDFNRSPRPRLRLLTNLFPTKYLYLVVGVDDFIQARQRELFFGFGLRIQ